MHTYPLHRAVEAKCACCKIDEWFKFKSSSDHVLCKACLRHQGDSSAKLKVRDFDHVHRWEAHFGVAQEERAAEEARLHDVIASKDAELGDMRLQISDLRSALEQGVDSAASPEVEHWFADQRIGEASEKRELAYRSRDRAFCALLGIDQRHHEDERRSGLCSCGQRLARCRDYEALLPVVNSLRGWENKQIDRLRTGLEHGLPDDHPEVQKHPRPRYRAG